MKRLIQAIVCLIVFFLMTGCAYLNVQTPLDKNFDNTELGTKKGISEARSILWLFSWGDAGIQAAAENGGINVINHADKGYFTILFGLYARITTVVYGDYVPVSTTESDSDREVTVTSSGPKPVVKEKIVIPDHILFGFDSIVINPMFSVVLEEVSKILQQKSNKGLVIEGHTDSTGPAGYNQLLSERRANAIKEFLVSKGLSPLNLTVKGFGEQKPIAENTTKEGRKRNRRVELKVLH